MVLVEPEFIKPMTYSASTIKDILDIVFFLKHKLQTPLWFRGQGVYYNLVPSILRKAVPIKDWRGEKWTGNPPLRSSGNIYAFPNQYKMIEEFVKISDHFFKEKPQNDYEWLCIMQHYGIPTTLLDWTLDPMTALFFATDIDNSEIDRRIKDEEYGAEFWIIPPVELNSGSGFKNQNRIFPCKDHYVEAFMNGEGNYLPIAIEAPNIEERLILQKGCFTMHGVDIRPLNHIAHHKSGFIYKIEIESKSLYEIRDALAGFGHTHAYYYPNDESKYKPIFEEIESKFLNKYLDYCKDKTIVAF